MSEHFQYKIDSKPEYSFLTVTIPANETLKVEATAMASMDTNLKMKTKLSGGFNRLLSKESIFINEYTAEGGNADISIAPGPSGDIDHFQINNEDFYLTSGSYLASTMGVNLDTKWQGITKGFFSGESFFLIKCSGLGSVWFNTYGAIFEVEVSGQYIVDTGHIVAFSSGLDYKISRLGGYKSLFFSGEGFICRFKGEGKIWIQSKNPNSFISWADQFRNIQRKDNS